MTRICVELDPDNGNGNGGPIVQTYTATLGDGSQSDFAVDHNLNSQGVYLMAYNANTGEVNQDYSVVLNSANRATVRFDAPPAANSIRVQAIAVTPRTGS